MAIDITGLNSAQSGGNRGRVNESQTNQNATASISTAQESSSTASSDTVKLSDTALSLQSAEHDVQSQPEVDTDRVSALKAAIEDGSYQVDSTRVAGQMMQLDSLFSD